jgi:hypothetical protein
MIIARSMTPETGEELLLFGLARVNIEQLLRGNPIRITCETHGAGVPLGWTIWIMFGETEKSIMEELREAGVFSPDLKVMAMPRSAT